MSFILVIICLASKTGSAHIKNGRKLLKVTLTLIAILLLLFLIFLGFLVIYYIMNGSFIDIEEASKDLLIVTLVLVACGCAFFGTYAVWKDARNQIKLKAQIAKAELLEKEKERELRAKLEKVKLAEAEEAYKLIQEKKAAFIENSIFI